MHHKEIYNSLIGVYTYWSIHVYHVVYVFLIRHFKQLHLDPSILQRLIEVMRLRIE